MRKITQNIVKYLVFMVMDAWIIYRHERKILQKARRVEFRKMTRELIGISSYDGDIWDDEDWWFFQGFNSYQDLVDAYNKKLSSPNRES